MHNPVNDIKIVSVEKTNNFYLQSPNKLAIQIDRSQILQEAILADVKIRAAEYNKLKVSLEAKETKWRKTNTIKQNTRGKLINKSREYKHLTKTAEDKVCEAQEKLKQL
jgi:hypothetical protein